MTNLFNLLKGEKEDDNRIPDTAKAQCNECNWIGIISDCGKEMDSEGWEYPEYEVLVCPNCGSWDVAI